MSQDHERSNSGWVLAGFLIIAMFLLLSEHRAHMFGALPFLLLLACPLLHVFHGGHGGHAGHSDARMDDSSSRTAGSAVSQRHQPAGAGSQEENQP